MDNYQIGLLTTVLLGIFILLGAGISLLINKKDKIIDFSIGLAFGVITTLIITDLLPEIFEGLGLKNIYVFIICTTVGFFLLRLLDSFIPDHHEHNHMNKKENTANLTHIGIMTTLALFLHNIIEGMAVYSTALSDSSLALSLAIGVGFHNVPLGMVIASSFYHSSKDKLRTIISVILASISTFCGGLIMYCFKFANINELFLGGILSITLGMLLFIVIDELYPRIKDTKQKKSTYTGMCIGIVILLLSMLIA